MTIYRLQGYEEKKKAIYYEYDADSTPLGEGAMGRVYKGYCVNERTKTKTPVAIKAISDNIPNTVLERARREANIRIDSPYLLHMLGFVEMPYVNTINGQNIKTTKSFVVMELLSGVTLHDLLNGVCTDYQGNCIPAVKNLHNAYIETKYPTIQFIMSKILRAVMALHNANFVHRDIDPSNIMVTSEGHVKLIDFGICKPINALGTQDKNLTSAGVFMGKVNYAAPELVIGDVAHQNPSTDIYALGILLFQLCTGHLPFAGEDNDILLAHMRKQLPLKEIEIRSLRKIIDKATKKSQSQRYRKAEDMLSDLEQIDFSTRKKRVWGYVVGFILTLILGLVLLFAYHDRITSDEKTGKLPTPSSITIPSEDETYFTDIKNRMWSNDKETVYNAFQELAKMAEGTRDVNAMFEFGLTFSVANEFFDIPLHRQRMLEIEPDIERANKWLMRTYMKDPSSYRAVYWRLNNLIAKYKQVESIATKEEISDWLNKFDEITQSMDDEVVRKYKNAVDAERYQLQQWGIQ